MRSYVEMRYWTIRWFYRKLGIQHPWQFLVNAMPKSLKYWVLLDQGVKHIRTNEIVPDVGFTTVLQRAGNDGGEKG